MLLSYGDDGNFSVPPGVVKRGVGLACAPLNVILVHRIAPSGSILFISTYHVGKKKGRLDRKTETRFTSRIKKMISLLKKHIGQKVARTYIIII